MQKLFINVKINALHMNALVMVAKFAQVANQDQTLFIIIQHYFVFMVTVLMVFEINFINN